MERKVHKKEKKRMDWRRVCVGILAGTLILSLLLPLLGNFAILAHAVTQADLKNQITSLKGDASAASAKKKELQTQLQSLQNDKAQALKRKELMDQQLAAIDAEVSATEQEIATYEALIVVQEDALTEAQEKEQEAYERFCGRVRAMEEAGNISYLSVLFQASSFSDLLDRLAMVDQIVTYDNAVVDTLADARAEVEGKLNELNATKEELDAEKAVLDSQRTEQSEKVEQAQALFDDLKKQANAAASLVAAEEAEEQKIAAQIAEKEKALEQLIKEEEERRRKEEEERKKREEEARKKREEEEKKRKAEEEARKKKAQAAAASAAAAAQSSNKTANQSSSTSSSSNSSGNSTASTGSGWKYPLPGGCTNITSPFGYRLHPLTGKPHSHTGIDIAAPGGTSVYAAQSGVVVVSGYAPSSYGEYVVISHGSGKTTLYAHMQRGSRKVSAGQTVKKGQVLGRVGSTGSATGNHLHLEYTVNGVRKNPVSLFPNIHFQ